MTTYTVHEYSEVQTHCSTDDNPNDCYAGSLGNTYFTLAINASGEFSYSSLATNGGTTWNLFQPSYVSDGATGAAYMSFHNGSSIPGQPVSIPSDKFPASIRTRWASGNDLYIYLQLFADTSQTGNPMQKVPLKYEGEVSTEGGGTISKFSFVSDANEPQVNGSPVCLTDTCDVLTPNGYVNVKDLSVGDKVTTPEGENVKITKVMKPQEYYVMGKAYPHFIPKNSLGENKPSKDTFISKNHAYKSGDEWLCGQFNIEHNATNWDKEYVTYYNVMTEDYPKHTLVVNGVEMESWGGYEHNKPETHKNVKLRREKLGFK